MEWMKVSDEIKNPVEKSKNEEKLKITNRMTVDWVNEKDVLKTLEEWLKSNKDFDKMKKDVKKTIEKSLWQEHKNSIFFTDPNEWDKWIDSAIISWMCKNQNKELLNNFMKDCLTWLASDKIKPAWKNYYELMIKKVITSHPEPFSVLENIMEDPNVEKWLEKFLTSIEKEENPKVAEFFSKYKDVLKTKEIEEKYFAEDNKHKEKI